MAEKRMIKEEILDEKEFIVELSGLIDSKLLNTNLDQANFLEIETQKPVLQIGNLLFQGTFEPFLGTAVCFQRQNDQMKSNINSNNDHETDELSDLKFLCTSDLKLKMKRIYLDKKKSHED